MPSSYQRGSYYDPDGVCGICDSKKHRTSQHPAMPSPRIVFHPVFEHYDAHVTAYHWHLRILAKRNPLRGGPPITGIFSDDY